MKGDPTTTLNNAQPKLSNLEIPEPLHRCFLYDVKMKLGRIFQYCHGM